MMAITHTQTISSNSAYTIGFLDLPMELRIDIYKLMRLSLPTWFARRDLNKARDFQIARFTTFGLPFLSCKNTRGPKTHIPTIFKDLRLCSRQIYAETKQYVFTPLVNLTIMENRLLTFCSAQETFDLLQKHRWMEQNIKEVNIKVWYFGTTISHVPSDEKRFFGNNNSLIPQSTLDKIYPWPYNTMTERGKDMKLIAKYLMDISRLEKVTLNLEIYSKHDMFFDIWRDPLGDAEVLYPLKKRGVRVAIQMPVDPGDILHNAFKRMMSRKKFWRRAIGIKTSEQTSWDLIFTS
jgi:hypothetical protein